MVECSRSSWPSATTRDSAHRAPDPSRWSPRHPVAIVASLRLRHRPRWKSHGGGCLPPGPRHRRARHPGPERWGRARARTSGNFFANAAWLLCAAPSPRPHRWTAMLGEITPEEKLTVARTVRTRFFSIPGRLVSRSGRPTLRAPLEWPWAGIRTRPPPPACPAARSHAFHPLAAGAAQTTTRRRLQHKQTSRRPGLARPFPGQPPGHAGYPIRCRTASFKGSSIGRSSADRG